VVRRASRIVLKQSISCRSGSAAQAPKQDHGLKLDRVHCGDCRRLLSQIRKETIACSFWSPPYHVGKSYEAETQYDQWVALLRECVRLHLEVLKPGAFLVVNINDILCFKDETMPRIQAATLNHRRCSVTREQILRVMRKHPEMNRYQLAARLGCSEQTIDRRLKHNNIRGGKKAPQTRVNLVGGLLDELACEAGLYLYDRRIWAKDPAWENCRWHTTSYRAVDDFEYLYMFWKPGITKVDRKRLRPEEWAEWGSRGVWSIPSVRSNDDHEAKFPLELARRVIRLFTDPGDIVLDCFMGSGTTGVAATELGRRFIGIELNPDYARAANQAARRAMKRLPLS